MGKWKYSSDKKFITLEKEPRSKLKITGTRFATVCGFNAWSTPFEAWCEITKTAKVPFEDSPYTLAGKAIEPKVIQYLKDNISNKVTSPEEYYGNVFSSVRYDFFKDRKIFGGMWDSVIVDKNGDIKTVIEIKTTKRVEDWYNGAPQYYLAQVCLYAYLLGVEDIILTATFLEDDDYFNPEKFVVTKDNTKIYPYKLSEVRFDLGGDHDYTFEELFVYATQWYNYFVKGAVSPEFDEASDKKILEILRKTEPVEEDAMMSIVSEINQLTHQIDNIKVDSGLDEMEKRLKFLKDSAKELLMPELVDGIQKVVCKNLTLSRTAGKEYADVDELKENGLTEYIKVKPDTYTLRVGK